MVKRSLTGSIAEDNDSIVGGVRTLGAKSLKKRAANIVARAAGRFDLEIVYKKPYDAVARESGLDWPARAESMIGLKRMTNIQDCIAAIIQDDVDGDLIEPGVWRGGATIFMKANLKAWGDTTLATTPRSPAMQSRLPLGTCYRRTDRRNRRPRCVCRKSRRSCALGRLMPRTPSSVGQARQDRAQGSFGRPRSTSRGRRYWRSPHPTLQVQHLRRTRRWLTR